MYIIGEENKKRKCELMKEKHIFSNQDLKKLLLPLMLEQLLNSLMGMVDTMMVSTVGSAAISAVSLVDSINILIIQAFAALAAGGTILCSQYIGSGSKEKAKEAAAQVVLAITVLSLAVTGVCLWFRIPLLQFIFGEVEADVMRNSQTYFLITGMSFPFIALYNCGAAIFRAQKNTKTPLKISIISNSLNIVGNACLIYGAGMGVAGAAIATLGSRIFSAVVVMWLLRNPSCELAVRGYHKIRPDWTCIRRIFEIGIPSGIENSMFQLGKLAIQSTVSMLGTVAIAAQAMTNTLEALDSVLAIGIGVGMMTVVGQCIGAGRDDEAKYYIKKLTLWAEAAMICNCLAVFALTRPVTILGDMEPASAAMCFRMMLVITIVKPIAWVPSFIPAYGMRAAGDVRFSMAVSCCSMWLFRVSLAVLLCRYTNIGPMGVWVAMFTDWTVRAGIFFWRYRSGRWLQHKVIG